MKNKLKIYNFDFGTITDQEQTIKFEMNSNQFTYDSINEIQDLSVHTDPLFLEIESYKESDTFIQLFFKKTSGLSNLITIKKEEYPVKISIAQKILEQDILNKYINEDIYISLNPATIYYHPMETVRYTYAGNKFMPRDTHTTLERYKACIVSILSNISYEKCLNSPIDVGKEANDFIREIYQQKTVHDLLSLIKQSNDYITYDYIENRSIREKKLRKKHLLLLTGVTTILVAGIVFLGVQTSNKEQVISAQYEEKLDEKDTLIQANEEFYAENYDEAIQLYKEVGYDSKLLASELVEKEQYQLALEVDENALEEVIQTMYANEKTDLIIELNGDNLSEELQAKLSDEKGIVNEDTTIMLNTLNFLDDENTAERLAQKYIQLNDLDSAKKVQEKYPENTKINELITKTDTEQQEIDKANAEVQKQIDELNKKKDETSDNKEKENLQKEIDSLKGQLK